MSTLHKSCLALSALVGATFCSTVSFGQALGLPNKPVRIIVPNAAAGPNDLVGRLISARLSETIGQPVIVDNRPSANGIVGSEIVAHAAPDGTTLAVGNSGTHAVNATLYKNPRTTPYATSRRSPKSFSLRWCLPHIHRSRRTT
jgi:tripartite-type tricarboxylate transporter receptor subunit TctC